VCGRWRLQRLADLVALLASELVGLAATNARTAMELRLDLHGPWLHVAVHDQGSNLLRLLTAWCTPKLPPQEADMAGPGRQLPPGSPRLPQPTRWTTPTVATLRR
jgi:hypothetical protein